MSDVYFYYKDKKSSRAVNFDSIEQLRQFVLAMREEMKKPMTCIDCGAEIMVFGDHTCPDVIDVESIELTPLLPEKTEKG